MTLAITELAITCLIAVAQVVALIVAGLSLIAITAEIVARVHNRKEEERLND